MTQSTLNAVAGVRFRAHRPQPVNRSRAMRRGSRISYLFVSGYAVLLLVFGLVPAIYALFLSFTDSNGNFSGVANFQKVLADFRFVPAVEHVGAFITIWLVSLVIFVVLLALVVHSLKARWLSGLARFVFYLPGALAGASSVLVWIFMVDPAVSPASGLLSFLGIHSFNQAISPGNLPVVFSIIAFWTGAGGWIVIMYGALNNISTEVMEAARIDGANVVQTALQIQLPLMRKWIAYMVIVSLAGGTQLFAEPNIFSQATKGYVGPDYSLNQLNYLYAFQQNDFNGSAALSVMLLVVSLALSSFFVARGGLFERD